MYAFVVKNARLVHAVYALGILTWFGVVYGYVIFFSLNRWYWLIFGPIILLFTLYHLISYGINLFYKAFDVRGHRALVKSFWQKSERPSVDVFLPICGEDISLLETTFAAVKDIAYANKTVYVLDDGGDEAAKKLAARLGFEYLSRPDRGQMKKAGNLKYGHERSKGEFIVVFDADFAPRPEFIQELLPYMQDPRVAIAQSPQYFQADADIHRRSPLEFGAGQTQEDFYRVIQVSRDALGGAICVGSNAVYRRSALDEIGGTVQIEHSEDVHTGFNLIAKGWKIKYVPLILAIGLCPDNLHAYFHQQHRWCSGSMSLMLSKKFRTAKISFAQRLCYWSGFLYYLTHALSLLMAFQVFVLLFRHFDKISLVNAVPFLPYISFSFIVLPLFRRSAPKYGSVLVRMAHSYSYSHAVMTNLLGRSLGWQPTNAKSNGVSKAFGSLIGFNALYVLAYATLVSLAASSGRLPITDVNYYSVLFWIFFFLATNGLFLWHGFRTMASMHDDRGWGPRTAASFAAVLLMLVTSGFVLTGNHPSIQATVVAAAPSSDELPPANVPAIEPAAASYGPYTVVAAEGDSVTTLYRRALGEYLSDRQDEIEAVRKIYVEDRLAKNDPRGTIYVGDSVTAEIDELDRAIAESAGLTDEEKAGLEIYAVRAGLR